MVNVARFDIQLVPATSWGKSLANLARQGEGFRRVWETIRQRELERAGYKCEICGDSGKVMPCHEKWCYDEASHVQKLVGYAITCRDCSNVLHMGRASTNPELWKVAIAHFTKVTGLTKRDFERAFRQAMDEWARRSRHRWHIDVSHELLARGFEDQINRLSWEKGKQK